MAEPTGKNYEIKTIFDVVDLPEDEFENAVRNLPMMMRTLRIASIAADKPSSELMDSRILWKSDDKDSVELRGEDGVGMKMEMLQNRPTVDVKQPMTRPDQTLVTWHKTASKMPEPGRYVFERPGQTYTPTRQLRIFPGTTDRWVDEGNHDTWEPEEWAYVDLMIEDDSLTADLSA